MIVRNENGPHLWRCLDSVRPFITSWAIVDTGSTDGTQDAIREYFAGLPGKLIEREWEDDFSCARNQALKLAEESGAAFAMVLDADDYIISRGPPVPLLPFRTDVVSLPGLDDGAVITLSTFIRLGIGLRFIGRVHEIVAREDGTLPIGTSDPAYLTCRTRDGSASADNAAKQAYYHKLLLRSVNENEKDSYAWESLARDALKAGDGETGRRYMEAALRFADVADRHRRYVLRLSRVSTFQPFQEHRSVVLDEIENLMELCPDRAEAPRWLAREFRRVGAVAKAAQLDAIADEKSIVAGAYGIDYRCYRQTPAALPTQQRTQPMKFIIVPPPVDVTPTCSHSFAACVTHVIDNSSIFERPASRIRAAQRILEAVETAVETGRCVALKNEDYDALRSAFEDAEKGYGIFEFTVTDNETKAVLSREVVKPAARLFLPFVDAVANAVDSEPKASATPSQETAAQA